MSTHQEAYDQAIKFEMPQVLQGTAVFFYPFHDQGQPRLSWVVRISRTGRNLMLRTADGKIMEGVRHVDDPKLEWNNDFRENGSWDFSDEWKRLEKEHKDIEARIAALEHTAAKTVSRRRKKSEDTTS